MSNTVDERVVGMKFDNAQFESGVKTTLGSLDNLNKSLKMEGATKGLQDVSKAAQNMQLGHIASTIDGIADRFKAAGIVAVTALANIATQAYQTGVQLVHSLTLEPLQQGFHEYETNLNSIQTVLSNTQAAGTTLDQVNDALQELNLYSDQTIYNFSEMAKNIGTFTAAGVALEPATAAIKGIANLAALSGSNSQQAATAMYQLSQAISAGRVSLMDWNSVVNAGMGGTVFQRALAQTAVAMGTLDASALTLSGAMQNVTINGESFRNSISAENGESWLTSEVLTNTLAQFTGDLTAAELAAQGFSEAQIEAIQKQAETARAAATEVKTMTQLFGALKESAGSGWAQTWQLIFGNFEEAKTMWSGVYQVMDSVIGGTSRARNELLQGWKDLGGRDVLIESFANAFEALSAILKPIGQAFQQIFPATTAQNLYDITVTIRDFTENLKVTGTTADNLRRTFAGVFAIFGIGWEVIKQVARVFAELFGLTFEGSGGILEFTANIGDFLVGMHKAVQEGEGLTRFFDGLSTALSYPIKAIKALGSFIGSLFGQFDGAEAAENVTDFVSSFDPLTKMSDAIEGVWSNILKIFEGVWKALEPISGDLATMFNNMGDSIASITGGFGLDQLIGGVNTGLLAYLVLTFTKLFGRDGVISQARAILDNVNDTLNTMQNTLRAATLLQIAIAIGVLTLSVDTLSKVDAEGLRRALLAISIMFTQLFASLTVLERMPSTNTAKLYAMATALILVGIAVKVLASAVEDLSNLGWEELTRGLMGVVILLGSITAAARLMPDGARLASTGVALLILAVGIKILASAAHDMAELDWEEMARGLTGVGALLAALTLFSRFANANAGGIAQGVGIVLLAAGIKILASALIDISGLSWENIGKGMATLATSLGLITAAIRLIPPTAPAAALGVAIIASAILILSQAMIAISGISWEEIGKGMTVIAGSLLLITAALNLIPPTAALSAAGVLIVAVAIEILADAMKKMGGMTWEEIAKGLVTLAGSLAIIVGAMLLMPAALPGAAALLLISVALTLLAGVLVTLGGMTWDEIIRGLVALAAVFVVLGLAALVLQPVIPAMLGLGVAIALIGAGLALAGAGVFLFAAGLTALSVASGAGTVAIVALVSAVIGLIPMLAEQLGIALVILVEALIAATPKIVELIVGILVQVIDGLIVLLPKVFELIMALIDGILNLLIEAVPKMVTAGLEILIGILRGIRDNIREVVVTAGEVIVEFLGGIGDAAPDIIQAGFDLIIDFIEGLTKAINDNSERMGQAGGDLAIAIIRGMANGLGAGVGTIKDKAIEVAKSALNGALNFLGIHSPSRKFFEVGEFSGQGMANGLVAMTDVVAKAGEGVGKEALDSVRKSLGDLSRIVSSDIDMNPTISPVLDLTDIRKNVGQIDRLLAVKPISAKATLVSATDVSARVQQNRDISAENEASAPGDTFSYTQINNSPKALSSAEIYRQTKNQLSTVKGV